MSQKQSHPENEESGIGESYQHVGEIMIDSAKKVANSMIHFVGAKNVNEEMKDVDLTMGKGSHKTENPEQGEKTALEVASMLTK